MRVVGKNKISVNVFNTLFFVGIITSLALAVVPVALAIDTGLEPVDCQGLGINCGRGDSSGTLIDYIRVILNVFLTLMGIITVIVVIYAGVQYITSAGESHKTSTAKATIVYALAGLIIIGLSFVIVNFVLGAIVGNVDGGGGAP